jgi:hypothetical protein
MKLIGDDFYIEVAVGGSAMDGAAPTFPAAVPLTGIFERVRIEDTVEETNVKGGGERAKSFRFHSEGTVIDIDGMAIHTGYLYAAAGEDGSRKGYYIQVTFRPYKLSGTTYGPYTGVITRHEREARNGGDQRENLRINCNPDYIGA